MAKFVLMRKRGLVKEFGMDDAEATKRFYGRCHGQIFLFEAVCDYSGDLYSFTARARAMVPELLS